MRVLVVEDEQNLRQQLKSALQQKITVWIAGKMVKKVATWLRNINTMLLL